MSMKHRKNTYIRIKICRVCVDEDIIDVSQVRHGHHIVAGGKDWVTKIPDHSDGDRDGGSLQRSACITHIQRELQMNEMWGKSQFMID